MDHRFDSLKYCLSGGSLTYGKRVYIKDWIDMENKNEWETIDTLTKDSNKTLLHVYVGETKDGYEYRLQRRKKEKEMPRLVEGMGIQFTDILGTITWGVLNAVNSFEVIARDYFGARHSVSRDAINKIFYDSKEIWRRE